MAEDFFPYHPLKLRLVLLTGFLVAAALAAWAALAFLEHRLPRDVLRAGLSGGLAAAFAFSLFRTRPRAGWGVRLTQLSVLISRPRGLGLIEVPWSAVKEVRRLGEKRDTLALWLDERERVLVPGHLFASSAAFEALAARIDERMPPPTRANQTVN